MSSPALAKAIEMAKLWGAELRLINIQSLMPATFMDYVPAGFDEEQRGQAETTLRSPMVIRKVLSATAGRRNTR